MQVAVQGKQVSVTRSALPWRHRWTNLAPLMASFWWIRGGIVDIYIYCVPKCPYISRSALVTHEPIALVGESGTNPACGAPVGNSFAHCQIRLLLIVILE